MIYFLLVLSADPLHVSPPTPPLSPVKVETGIDTVAYRMTRNPGEAAWLSALVPGAGQVYLGYPLKGALFLGVVMCIGAKAGLEAKAGHEESATNWGLWAFGIWMLNVADAYAFTYLRDIDREAKLVEEEVSPTSWVYPADTPLFEPREVR